MYQGFLAALREACGIAKVNVDDGTIGTHSLRRGGWESMQDHGGDLWEILDSGNWNSKSFMDYLNKSKLQREAMTEIINDYESSSEEEFESDNDSSDED